MGGVGRVGAGELMDAFEAVGESAHAQGQAAGGFRGHAAGVEVRGQGLQVGLGAAQRAEGAVDVHVSPEAKASFEPLGEALAELAKFAALLTPQLFGDLSLGGYAAVVLAIVLIRPASLLISLLGTAISRKEKLVATWFGPKGFAFSIVAHSSTDVPIARLFHIDAPTDNDTARSAHEDDRAAA